MARRFHVDQLPAEDHFVLNGPETHHLRHVLRIAVGEEVILFDGHGIDAVARVAKFNTESVELVILSRGFSQAELPVPVTLATAVPKGDRFAWLVEKATELGVSTLVPLNTARSIVDPGVGKLAKMRQAVVTASKQCRRSQLMEIAEPLDWMPFITAIPPEALLLVADPAGEPWSIPSLVPDELAICIGPEGGLTSAEVAYATDRGARIISLGPRILRIETAGLALATLVGDWLARDAREAMDAT